MDQSVRDKYTAVIGLEVHAQLLTKSKIFTSDSTEFGRAPNTNVSVISLAHPGTLPKLNKTAVEFAVKMGMACHSEISRTQIFDRKNYFYPDLPKGYQITQDRTPICKKGYLEIELKSGKKEKVQLNRIHLEEDAGKSIHLEGENDSAIDFNRAGVPLIEIVTEPCMHSSEEAYVFLKEVRQLVRYLDICDGNMEEGSLRCDANVSVMLQGAAVLGKKVEIKNMNSIRNVQHAIDYEIERQIHEIEKGNPIPSETRTFDVDSGMTRGMRMKEELNDYRYFPDPDISPLNISEEWLDHIREAMPVLPDALFEKFVSTYQLPSYDAEVLTQTRGVAIYFEEVCKYTGNFKAASNWVMGPLKSIIQMNSLEGVQIPLDARTLAELIRLIDEGTISYTAAVQRIFPELIRNPKKGPRTIAEELNLLQERNTDAIMPIVIQVLKEFPLKVEEYKNGKNGIVSMFMGEVMKRSKGKADPKMANELLLQKLSEK